MEKCSVGWRAARHALIVALLLLAVLACVDAHAGHDQHHDHDHRRKHHEQEQRDDGSVRAFVWSLLETYPLPSSFLVLALSSTAPLFLIYLLPPIPTLLLQVLVSFAVGAVLGDVFLHLLPEVISAAALAEYHQHSGHNHSLTGLAHSHSHTGQAIGMAVLSGLVSFFLLEKVMGAFGFGHGSHNHDNHSAHEHSHDHNHSAENHHNHIDITEKHEKILAQFAGGEAEQPKSLRKRRGKSKKRKQENGTAHHEDDSVKSKAHDHTHAHDHSAHDHSTHENESHFSHALLHTIASGTHCFADGLTVVLSFVSGGPAAGLFTTLAVLLHEIPHKLGDYAILIKQGLSKPMALRFMLFGSFGSFLGGIFGAGTYWFAGGQASVANPDGFLKQRVMPFTAGGLVYLALVGVLPTISATPRGYAGLFQTSLLLLGLAAGIGMMANMSH
ncbi:Zinc/iron permease [Cladochytrium replicatum]|nr:Zinc/iron permease [Cladochytrium replicatum]